MNYLILLGPTWKNCGASGGQEQALAADTAFQKSLTSTYSTILGQNQAIFSDMTNGLTQIFNAGPSQQGESPAALAVQNSQAINSAAAANQQVQQAIGEKAATNGTVPGIESGVIQAERASAATSVENNLSNQEAGITAKNYAIGNENYNNATKELAAVPGELESPITSAANPVNTSNATADAQANANAAANSQWVGLVQGLASDAAGIGASAVKPGGAAPAPTAPAPYQEPNYFG